ncbi:MAG: hypothetical protein CL833_09715 [Crocinitomicaceae bacterium]|nr:hypothetical protein [Crocinitomicaceae bacterium]|tara:strand:+ start:1191 stop:1910 length:720 start_codon:yes stop_codon:yes gene_type:complete
MSAVASSFDYFSTKAPVLRQPLGKAADTQVFGVPGLGLVDNIASAGGKRLAKNVGGDAVTAGIQKKVLGELSEELGEEAAEGVAKRVGKELAESGVTKATKGEVIEKITKELVEDGVSQEVAEKVAKEAVQKQVKANAINSAAQKIGSTFIKGGIIAGVAYGFWSFGAGFVGAAGDLLGEAGQEAATNTIEWMGDNPIIAAGITGLGLLLVGGFIISLVAPGLMAKKAKDAATGDDDGE